MRHDLLTEANLLIEIDFTQGRGNEIRLGDDDLLLETEAVDLDIVHAVAQNRVNLLMIIMAEDEQTAAQIEIDAREVLVLEAVILTAVRQVNEQIVDLLTLGRLRDLVKLIEVDDRVHALGLDQHVHDAPPRGALICVRVAIQEGGVRRSAKRDEMEWTTQCLGHAVLDESRLANTGRAVDAEHVAGRLRICDPAADKLHDLELRLLVSVDCRLHLLAHRADEVLAGLLAVLELNGQILIDAERQLRVAVEPLAGLVVFGARRINVDESIVLGEGYALHLGRHILRHNLELERYGGLCRLDLRTELCKKLVLSTRCQTLEITNVAIDVLLVIVYLGLYELHKAPNILGLLAELVLLGLLRTIIADVGNEKLDSSGSATTVILFILILLLFVLLLFILLLFVLIIGVVVVLIVELLFLFLLLRLGRPKLLLNQLLWYNNLFFLRLGLRPLLLDQLLWYNNLFFLRLRLRPLLLVPFRNNNLVFLGLWLWLTSLYFRLRLCLRFCTRLLLGSLLLKLLLDRLAGGDRGLALGLLRRSCLLARAAVNVRRRKLLGFVGLIFDKVAKIAVAIYRAIIVVIRATLTNTRRRRHGLLLSIILLLNCWHVLC